MAWLIDVFLRGLNRQGALEAASEPVDFMEGPSGAGDLQVILNLWYTKKEPNAVRRR